MLRLRHRMLALLLLFATSGCYPDGAPPVGINTLDVPFSQQRESYFCVPATILMWMRYKDRIQYVDTLQYDIFSQAESNGWATRFGSNPGVHPQNIPSLAQARLGVQMYRTTYSPADARKAISDELKQINIRNPTIAEANYGTHAVLVVGTSWSQVENALRSPRTEYMVIHDPDYYMSSGLGRNYIVYMHNWLTIVGITCPPPAPGQYGCMAVTSMWPGLTALAELEEFDSVGGTYYGDPNPPQVGRWKGDGNGGCYWDETDIGPDQCSPTTGRWKVAGDGSCYWDPNDSGPDQCVPSSQTLARARPFGASVKHLLRGLFAKPSLRASFSSLGGSHIGSASNRVNRVESTAVQRPASRGQASSSKVNPPFPQAKTKEEVLANVLHTVKLSRLYERPEFKVLAADGNVQARRVISVSSALNSVPDYHIIFIDDTAGSLVAAAIVGSDGLLGEITALGKDDVSIEPPRLEDVTARLRHRFDVVKAEYYFAGNNLSPSGNRFRPLVRAETAAGIVYVTVKGELYTEDVKRPYVDSIDKEASDLPRKYPGMKWLVTSDGIVLLKKAGRLD